MDIVEKLKAVADEWGGICGDDFHVPLDTAAAEITHLREQLAASQAECIALQNRMDEQVTAWRAECLDLQNKLAEATEKAE